MSIIERAIPGGWSDREVIVGEHTFRLYTPTDPDEVLGQIESPEGASEAHLVDPYWAKLWPAAPHLAAAVLKNPPPRGTRVLELGCGSGLVGIAGLASGLAVTFSDYVPLAVDLALENAAHNGFPNGRGLVLDWRSTLAERFPRIFAADVTYDRVNLDPLLNVVEQMLEPGGEAWFGDAGRSPAEDFVARATRRGWAVSMFDENDQLASISELGKYRRIVLRRP